MSQSQAIYAGWRADPPKRGQQGPLSTAYWAGFDNPTVPTPFPPESPLSAAYRAGADTRRDDWERQVDRLRLETVRDPLLRAYYQHRLQIAAHREKNYEGALAR